MRSATYSQGRHRLSGEMIGGLTMGIVLWDFYSEISGVNLEVTAESLAQIALTQQEHSRLDPEYCQEHSFAD